MGGLSRLPGCTIPSNTWESDTIQRIIVIAGPNGAGKSTLARHLLPKALEFVNADDIARALPEDFTGNRDLEAGRILLRHLDELKETRQSFAVETTLASRGLAQRIASLRRDGYRFELIFIWSPSVDLSISRVASRVRAGGHDIPEDTIRRRYASGLRNFFGLYQPLADRWRVYRNDAVGPHTLIASGQSNGRTYIRERTSWRRMLESSSEI